ncbi:MAG: hypothetical protein ACOX8S_04695 [Christensenellales bacterium]|jgi:hypothetical protein
MHAIPVLIVKSPTPGLLMVNGHATCELDGAASLPVSNTGDVFLLFTPYEGFLPAAMKLSFVGGDLVMKDYPFQVTLWPDNIAEVELSPRPIGSALPGRVADELTSGGLIFSLIRQEGFTLLVEDRDSDKTLYRLNMPLASTGSLRELGISGQAVVGALMEEESGQRLLLFSAEGGDGLKLLADARGDSIRFEEEGALIRTAKSLSDEAGHGEVCLYERQEDGSYKLTDQSYMLEHDGPAVRSRSIQSLAKAFTQALALGLIDEAFSYISPHYLEEIGEYELRMFLGAYSSVEDARYCPAMQEDTALALMTYTAQNARVARVYAFEFDEDGISAIKRYDPRGMDS